MTAEHKLDIVFLSGGLPHRGDTLTQKSLGGSETACILLAKALAKRGHHVTAFTPCDPAVIDDVTWLPIQSAPGYIAVTPHDLSIISRQLDWCRWLFASKLRVLWCHDLHLKRQRNGLAGTLWNLDAIYTLSAFHRQQLLTVHGESIAPLVVQTRNGIDLPSFAGLAQTPRDRNLLVYGSRPERGLVGALEVMRRLPEMRLEVAWYDNAIPELQQFYQAVWQQAEAMPNVKLLGPLLQHDWHRKVASALGVLYPGAAGEFREISWVIGLEAQACGTPVIGAAKGALPETVGPAGILLGDDTLDVTTPQYFDDVAAAVRRLHADHVAWDRLSQIGLARAQGFGWDSVAESWETDWLTRLDAQTGDAWRMRKHFERMGDHEAAAALEAKPIGEV